MKTETMNELRNDLALEQKEGLPFIISSIVIWGLIAVVSLTNLPIQTKNMITFCCSCPLLPLAWLFGKLIMVDIFSKKNPLGSLGFIFTLNQLVYLLIVMWVFSAKPESMVMVYAMVFGAHLLPYSWIYRSKIYAFFSIEITIVALVLGCIFNAKVVAITGFFTEIVFAIFLLIETFSKQRCIMYLGNNTDTEKNSVNESCDKCD